MKPVINIKPASSEAEAKSGLKNIQPKDKIEEALDIYEILMQQGSGCRSAYISTWALYIGDAIPS